MTLNKINLSIRDFKEQDINQIINDEQYFFAASRVFQNNSQQIFREIEKKQRIVISKMVYSKGQNNKFVIIAQ